jgi:mRNA interferase MazF
VVSEIRQGEVYWIDFGPVTGSAPAERHPCVVVQSDLFNRSGIGTTVVCLITSNPGRSHEQGDVTLMNGEANLPKANVVNVSQVLTIDKAKLVERIGILPADTLEAIRSGLQLLFDRV